MCKPAAKLERSRYQTTPVSTGTSLIKKAVLSLGTLLVIPSAAWVGRCLVGAPHAACMCVFSYTHTHGPLGVLEFGPVSIVSFLRSDKGGQREVKKVHHISATTSYVRLSDFSLQVVTQI